MRLNPRKPNKQSSQPHLNFRNTRSKFFKNQSRQFDDNNSDPSKKSQQNTGSYWKQQGNQEFKKGNIHRALEYYTKAIEQTQSESVYYCNRARCYKILGDYKEALKDAEQACELQPDNIKANYICGCVLAEMGKYDKTKLSKAENRFKKALRLCLTYKKTQFEDQISIKFYRLKKLVWYIERNQEIEDLIVEKNALNPKNIDPDIYQRIVNRLEKRLNHLQNFQKRRQIPDYLCCKITLELMEEPTTTQDGLTYEKSALEDHFKTNGFIEPISRKSLTTKPYPNLGLKTAVENFLEQNPWAFEDDSEQNYLEIQF